MSSYELISVSFSLFVFIFFLVIISGFLKSTHKKSSSGSLHPVSIIVPFKNEEKNLPALFEGLSAQKNFSGEVIFVNDHSSDHSLEIVRTFSTKAFTVRHISLGDSQEGKKTAIEEGIKHSEYETILITDADCLLKENWAISHIAYEAPDVINAGMVEIQNASGLWNKFQQLEMMGIMGVSTGMNGIGHPIAMSGANLSYSKTLFQKLDPYSANKEIFSGDDIYLLQKAKSKKVKIQFLSSLDSHVVTYSQSFRNYIRQRVRWMKKRSSLSDAATIFAGLILFLSAGQFLFLTGYQLITLTPNVPFLISLGLKMIVDFLLLFLVARHWKKTELMVWFLPAFLINVFLMVVIPVSGWFIPVSWKGRKI